MEQILQQILQILGNLYNFIDKLVLVLLGSHVSEVLLSLLAFLILYLILSILIKKKIKKEKHPWTKLLWGFILAICTLFGANAIKGTFTFLERFWLPYFYHIGSFIIALLMISLAIIFGDISKAKVFKVLYWILLPLGILLGIVSII